MITDIISSDIAIGGVSEFDTDSGVNEVQVIPPGAEGLVFEDGNGNTGFLDGENFVLVAASVNIPFGFGQGEGRAYIGIAWKNAEGDYVIIPELAGNSILVFPSFCKIEFPPEGLFISCPKTGGPHRLFLTNIVMNVSQVGLPAQLEGETFKLQFHLQINHTRPLQPLS